MSYKFTTGSVRRGDIYFEDDRVGEPTYINFEDDEISFVAGGVTGIEISGSGDAHIDGNIVLCRSPLTASTLTLGRSAKGGEFAKSGRLIITGSDVGEGKPMLQCLSDSNFDILTVSGSGRVGIGGPATAYHTLDLTGSIGFNVASFSAAAQLGDTHNVVIADCNGGSVTLTLPAATANLTGRRYIIKRADSGGSGGSNDLIIARNGANIDGASSNISEINNGACNTLICIGTNGWIRISEYVPI
jgi:hypothetical protein